MSNRCRDGLLALVLAVGVVGLATGCTTDFSVSRLRGPGDGQAPDADATGPDSTAGCPEGQVVCTDRCVDTQTNANHCGGCNSACPTGPNTVARCVDGACRATCVEGFADCDGEPANGCEASLETSRTCGSCAAACAEPTPACARQADGTFACVGGCATGQTMCGGTCADLRTNSQHCGRCDRACASGASCVDGTCQCSNNLTECNGTCVDTVNNDLGRNCGGCGRDCQTAHYCSRGMCCPWTYVSCEGQCINVQIDPQNCGACGQVCPASRPSCRAGTCV